MAKKKQEVVRQQARPAQLQRLAFARQYSEVLDQSDLKGLYAIYIQMTVPELELKVKDKNITVAERSVLVNLINASSAKKSIQLQAVKYVDERTYGKVPDVIQVGGNKNAPPIEMKDVTSSTEDALKKMTPEELRDLKKFTAKLSEKNKG